jgi:hypothetical protein
MRRFGWIMLVIAPLTVSVAAAVADPPPAGAPTQDGMKILALQWFAQMQAGKIDRTQYAAAYGAQLTDEAVQAMSRHVNQYGASPTSAEIMHSRTIDNQTFYLVKLMFPRGDATSLLFGFDSAGKITGIGVESMAGTDRTRPYAAMSKGGIDAHQLHDCSRIRGIGAGLGAGGGRPEQSHYP